MSNVLDLKKHNHFKKYLPKIEKNPWPPMVFKKMFYNQDEYKLVAEWRNI